MPVACCGVTMLPNVQPSQCSETIAKTVNATGCEEKIHDFMPENAKTMEITFSVLIAFQVCHLLAEWKRF